MQFGEGNGNPLKCSCLENPRDGEPSGLQSMGSHRVGHDWGDLAAAAAAYAIFKNHVKALQKPSTLGSLKDLKSAKQKKQATKWKDTHGIGGKKCKPYIFGKGLLSKILNSISKSPYIIPIKMGEGPEKTFVQRRYTKAREKMLRSLNIRDMQMKTMMKYHCQAVRMASIKKKRQQMLQGARRTGNPSTLLVALQTGAAAVENSTEGPQN